MKYNNDSLEWPSGIDRPEPERGSPAQATHRFGNDALAAATRLGPSGPPPWDTFPDPMRSRRAPAGARPPRTSGAATARPLLLLLAIVALFAFFALPGGIAQAQTRVSNIGQATASYASTRSSNSMAQAFTTGSAAGGYNLASVDLDVSSHVVTSSDVSAAVYSENSGDPDSVVHGLSNPTRISSGTRRFTAPAGATLDAGTTYFVVITSTSSAGLNVRKTTSDSEDAGSTTGWSIADDRVHQSGSGWSTSDDALKIRVNARVSASDGGLPHRPTDLVAVLWGFSPGVLSASACYVDLRFLSPASNGGSRIHRYEIRSNGGTWEGPSTRHLDESIHSTDSGRRVHDWEITQLRTCGVTYTDEVRAVNATGASAPSNLVTFTAIYPAPPGAPGDLTAVSSGEGQVKLSWSKAPVNRLSGRIWDYGIRYKAGSGEFNDWTKIPGSDEDTTSHVVTGLTAGTMYTFEVHAVNNEGTGAAASVDYTELAKPDAPENLSAKARSQQVTLNWTTASDGGSAILKYQVRRKAGTGSFGNWTDITNSGPATTSHTVTSLTNGTEYTFELHAVNEKGAGPPASVQATAGDTKPGQPVNLTATESDRRARLSWITPDDGGSAILRYEWRYQEGTDPFGAWTTVTDSGATTTSFRTVRLTGETAYLFEVNAVNAQGNGLAAQVGMTTPKYEKPHAPADLTAVLSMDGQSVTLSWTTPFDGNARIDKYQMNRKTGSGSYSGFVDIAGSDAAAISHTVGNLTAGETHYFRVRAHNGEGFGASSAEVNVSVPGPNDPPGKPVNFTARAGSVDRDQVTLAWSTPYDGGSMITKYQYRQRTDGSTAWSPDWTDIDGSGATTTTHTVTSLDIGKTYVFELRAVNDNGNGVAARGTATTRALPPGELASFGVDIDLRRAHAGSGNGAVRLTLGIPADDGGAALRYRYRWRSAGGAYSAWTNIAAADLVSSGGGTAWTHDVTGLGIATVVHEDTAAPGLVFEAQAVNSAGQGRKSSRFVSPLRYRFELAPRDWQAGADAPGFDEGGSAEFRITLAGLPARSGNSCTFDSGFDVGWTATDVDNFLDATAGTVTFSAADACSGFADFSVASADDSVNQAGEGEVTLALAPAASSLEVGATPPSVRFRVRDDDDPPAPVALAALRGDGEVKLTWQAPPVDAMNTLTGYQLRYAVGGVQFGDWEDIPTSGPGGANETAYVITDLANGWMHTFQVRTSGALGFGAPAEATQTPRAPRWTLTTSVSGVGAFIDEGDSVTVTIRTSNDVAFFSAPESVTLVVLRDLRAGYDNSSPMAGSDYTAKVGTTAITAQSRYVSPRHDPSGWFTGNQAHYALQIPVGGNSASITLSAVEDDIDESDEESEFLVLHDGREVVLRDMMTGGTVFIIRGANTAPTLVQAEIEGTTATMKFDEAVTWTDRVDPENPRSNHDYAYQYFGLFERQRPSKRHGVIHEVPGAPEEVFGESISIDGTTVTVTFERAARPGVRVWLVYEYSDIYAPLVAVQERVVVGSHRRRPVKSIIYEFVNVTTGTPALLVTSDGDVSEAAGSATFTVTSSIASTDTVTVDYATPVRGDATAGDDYTAVTGTLTFSPGGALAQTLSVTVIDDTVVEPDEPFWMDLTNPQNATLGHGEDKARVYILNDDEGRGVTVAPTALTVTEGSSAPYTVVLESAPTADVTVTVTVPAETDVTTNATELTFTPSNWETAQTVTVTAAEDEDAVVDAPVTITHAVAGGNYAGETAESVVVTVEENDTPELSVASIPPEGVQEDAGSATFTVELSLASGNTVTVDWATGDDTAGVTATAGDDYTSGSGSLTFAPGGALTQTVTVAVTDDAVDEPAETFKVTLSDASQATLAGGGTTVSATGKILDNDERAVTVTPTALTVPEGEEEGETYTVVLQSEPTADVTVTATVPSGTDVTVGRDRADVHTDVHGVGLGDGADGDGDGGGGYGRGSGRCGDDHARG